MKPDSGEFEANAERGRVTVRPRRRPCRHCYEGRVVVRGRPSQPRHERICPVCEGSGEQPASGRAD